MWMDNVNLIRYPVSRICSLYIYINKWFVLSNVLPRHIHSPSFNFGNHGIDIIWLCLRIFDNPIRGATTSKSTKSKHVKGVNKQIFVCVAFKMFASYWISSNRSDFGVYVFVFVRWTLWKMDSMLDVEGKIIPNKHKGCASSHRNFRVSLPLQQITIFF